MRRVDFAVKSLGERAKREFHAVHLCYGVEGDVMKRALLEEVGAIHKRNFVALWDYLQTLAPDHSVDLREAENPYQIDIQSLFETELNSLREYESILHHEWVPPQVKSFLRRAIMPSYEEVLVLLEDLKLVPKEGFAYRATA
jgi:hypothetical protein